MTNQILLARHGSVDSTCGGFLGRTDLPLATRGRCEARLLAETLRGRKVDRIVSSPMKRAAETAGIVAEALQLNVTFDDDLRELDFGDWEGKPFHEICSECPQTVERWIEFANDFKPPGGEVLGDFLDRVRDATGRLNDGSDKSVLAVTHGGVIRHALCNVLGLNRRQYLLFDVQPASLTTIRMFGDKGVLQEMRNVHIKE